MQQFLKTALGFYHGAVGGIDVADRVVVNPKILPAAPRTIESGGIKGLCAQSVFAGVQADAKFGIVTVEFEFIVVGPVAVVGSNLNFVGHSAFGLVEFNYGLACGHVDFKIVFSRTIVMRDLGERGLRLHR